MTVSQDMAAFKDDIAGIEEKRRVLEQIVDIARTIENMQESMESVLVLGASSKEMPAEAMDLYSSLSDNLRNLPVNKISEYLKNLELIIKNQLEQILSFSGMDFSSDEAVEVLFLSSDSNEKNPLELLEDFRRTAQTAVSLRVLLKKRGVATEGASLPVSQEVIGQQIKRLEAQEQEQRDRARSKILEMKDDIQRMIDNPAYPDQMKSLLAGVQANLDNDLKGIDSGVDLGRLSFMLEAGEIAAIDEEPFEEEEIVIEGVSEERERTGLAAAASRWLNSPWDVSWEEAKSSK
jgi:hypothetical protein